MATCSTLPHLPWLLVTAFHCRQWGFSTHKHMVHGMLLWLELPSTPLCATARLSISPWTIIGGKFPKKCLYDLPWRLCLEVPDWLPITHNEMTCCIKNMAPSSPTLSNTLQCSPLQVDMKIATCPAPRNSVGGTKCSSPGFIYDSDKIETHQRMLATLQCNTFMLTTSHLNKICQLRSS